MRQNHSQSKVFGFGPKFDDIEWGSDHKPDLLKQPEDMLTGVRSYVEYVIQDLLDLANKAAK